jgi:ABC-2 type transport system ATP-binding protein
MASPLAAEKHDTTTSRRIGMRPSTDAIVSVCAVHKRFNVRRSWQAVARHPLSRERVEVLRGVTLEVRRGEFFGLLGPNGAGKTTLFKILATLVLPDHGRVRVAGIDPTSNPGGVRRVLTPVIADDRSLYWRLTGAENLLLFAALNGIPRCERKALVHELLESVGLRDASERMVGTYSSGMKQRVLRARPKTHAPAERR